MNDVEEVNDVKRKKFGILSKLLLGLTITTTSLVGAKAYTIYRANDVVAENVVAQEVEQDCPVSKDRFGFVSGADKGLHAKFLALASDEDLSGEYMGPSGTVEGTYKISGQENWVRDSNLEITVDVARGDVKQMYVRCVENERGFMHVKDVKVTGRDDRLLYFMQDKVGSKKTRDRGYKYAKDMLNLVWKSIAVKCEVKNCDAVKSIDNFLYKNNRVRENGNN